MASSSPPERPDEIEGESSSAGPYVIGIALLALLGGGLFWWKNRTPDAPPPTPKPVASEPGPQLPQRNDAPPPPPPPPPPPEETASAVASASGSAPAKVGGPAVGGRGPCAKCGDGKGSAALSAAVRSAAQSAQGCYNKALQRSEAQGSLSVSVQVGSTGSVCSASIGNDTVGSPAISSCVLGRFQGKTFPPPEQGCVIINVPISFSTK